MSNWRIGRVTICLLAAGLLLGLAGKGTAQGTWEDWGEGSGQAPGVLRLSELVPGANPEMRHTHAIVTVGQDNTPRILFHARPQDPFGLSGIYAAQWNGSSWVMAEELNHRVILSEVMTEFSGRPSLARGGNTMFLAFAAAPSGGGFAPMDAYVSFHNPVSGWTGRGGSMSQGGITGMQSTTDQVVEVATAADQAGNAYVAYTRGGSRQETGQAIYLKRLTGDTWHGMDNSDTEPVSGEPIHHLFTHRHPALGMSGTRPVLAWMDMRHVEETVRVKRWNPGNQTWQAVGNAGPGGEGLGFGQRPQVANLPGRDAFFVAFEEKFGGTLHIHEWTGSSWADRGNPLQPWGLEKMSALDDRQTDTRVPSVPSYSLALNSQGRPIVAFRAPSPENPNNHHLYVSYRNTDGVWEALGDPNVPGGVSQTPYTPPANANHNLGHYDPYLFVGKDNRPVLAWTFAPTVTGPSQVLVKRFDRSVGGGLPNVDLMASRLLGEIDGNPTLADQLDFNNDGAVDAADLRRLARVSE